MKGLRKFLRKFEDVMVAAAYAEEGDTETAKNLLKRSEVGYKKIRDRKIGSSKPIILKPSHL